MNFDQPATLPAPVTATTMLEPGQVLRPQISEEQVVELLQELYGLTVTKITEQNSYVDKNFHIKVAETWKNPHIQRVCPEGYILKVLNVMDSQNKHVDAELEMQHLLLDHGLMCPRPVPNIHGQERSLEKITHDECLEHQKYKDANSSHAYDKHSVRLQKFVAGRIFHSVPYAPNLLFEAGELEAKMHTVFMDLQHEALDNHQILWNIDSLPHLRRFVYAVEDEHYRDLVKSVIDTFEAEVIPQYPHFQKGVIHGDVNHYNIIVQEIQKAKPSDDNKFSVCGIIDFGHASNTYYVFEVAITIAYLSLESEVVDPLLAGGHVLAGYLRHRTLNDAEFDALNLCIAARCCQSLVIGAYTYSMDPGNEYAITTDKKGWKYLERLWKTPKQDLYCQWREIIKNHQI